jgi:hypothetical protein
MFCRRVLAIGCFFLLVTSAGYAQPVKQVRKLTVVDTNGKKVGDVLNPGDAFPLVALNQKTRKMLK